MQISTFRAQCDVQLGDKVLLANIPTEIVDIRCSHYLACGKVEFEFKLDLLSELWCTRNEFVYPVPSLANNLGQITEVHPDGPACSPEIVAMMQNGTLCEQCGCHMGKPTGYLRLCEDCGGDQG